MSDFAFEEAIYSRRGIAWIECQARSPGFDDDWWGEVQRLCEGFGECPPETNLSGCLFVQPFGKKHIAVVQVADQVVAGLGALSFHFLIIPSALYIQEIGDPFALADRYPARWQSRGQLPPLAWAAEPMARRKVEQVQQILREGDGPTLLGGTQALVDGARLIFERPQPDPALIKSLWALLPTSTRSRLWPATFAFSTALRFDVLVSPRVPPEGHFEYLSEEQAGDYPQGYYELSLQIAAEAGDQHEIDRLFGRRSRGQTWRLGLIIAAVAIVLVVAMALILPQPTPRKKDKTLPLQEPISAKEPKR